jgi:type III pantothenate kinase
MLQALHTGTSLLPQVELSEAAPLLGKDTASCMLSGVVHGGAALLEGLCRRFAAHLDAPVHAVLTGGDAPLLQAHAPCFAHADPALVLRGLALAWRRRVGKGY